jgi:pyruvate dehydrogenase E1 component beta subunit
MTAEPDIEPSESSSCGVAGEIAAIVAEEGFSDLKAPIRRVIAPDVHAPFARSLEVDLYPNADKIVAAAKETV